MALVQVEVGLVSPLDRFVNLAEGQVFKYMGTYWLKIDGCQQAEFNAFTFDQWHVAKLENHALVHPVNSKLIVEY